MDLSQLGESAQYMVPLIILFCMCIGYVIKTSLDFIENKYVKTKKVLSKNYSNSFYNFNDCSNICKIS